MSDEEQGCWLSQFCYISLILVATHFFFAKKVSGVATLSCLLLSKYYISILGSSGVGENPDFAHTGEESFWRIWAYSID